MIGLIVDSAREFISIPSNVIQPPNEAISGTRGKYIEAIATLGERIILILNLDEVIDPAETIEAEG
jgi:purine-binding chemotaxis protein CheW